MNTATQLTPAEIAKIIKEDTRLQRAENEGSRALMRWRWHWTHDESNPKRMTQREYANAKGISESGLSIYIRGYMLLLTNSDMIPIEALERARMSPERTAIAQAVADARGKSLSAVLQTHNDDIKEVREEARKRAKARGTTVAEEAPKVAAEFHKAELARDPQIVRAEWKLMAAKREIRGVIKLSVVGKYEEALLSHALDNLEAVLRLIGPAAEAV